MQYESPLGGADVSAYLDPDPSTGTEGSLVRAPAIENAMRELHYYILQSGLTPSRADLTQLYQATQLYLAAKARPKLITDLNYHVSTTGSDAANGLTVGTPFATWNKALVAASAWDLNGHSIVVNIADGTYTAAVSFSLGFVGVGSAFSVVIRGNLANPQNVILDVTGANAIRLTGPTTGVTLQGFEVRTTGLGNTGISISDYARATYDTVRFGPCGENHIQADALASITATGPYSIVGGARQHWNAADGGKITVGSQTVTLTGTPAFSVAFGNAREVGNLRVVGTTFVGSATGKRFQSATNSLIYVNGAGDLYFPGTLGGSRTDGGVYV